MIEDEEKERRGQRPISYSATKQLIEDEERERREEAKDPSLTALPSS